MKGLYQRGHTFWIRFTPAEGAAQERFSLGTSDEAKAIELAKALIERVSHKAREHAGSCEAEIAGYLAAKKADGLARSTLDTRGYILRSFVAEVQVATPGAISRPAVERWFEAQRTRNPRTACEYLAKVSLWLAWLVEKMKIPVNHAAAIKTPKLSMQVRRTFLMPDQAKALLDACTSPCLKFALYCGLHAGMRKLEIIEARPEWFDLKAGLIHLQATSTFQTKDRDARTVPLTAEFKAWLETDYGLPTPFMLRPKIKHGKNRYRYDFKKSYDNLVASLGLEITFHDLRRTFASLHVSRGTSLYKVAKWLGDGAAVVEKTYGHLIPNDSEINAVWK